MSPSKVPQEPFQELLNSFSLDPMCSYLGSAVNRVRGQRGSNSTARFSVQLRAFKKLCLALVRGLLSSTLALASLLLFCLALEGIRCATSLLFG